MAKAKELKLYSLVRILSDKEHPVKGILRKLFSNGLANVQTEAGIRTVPQGHIESN